MALGSLIFGMLTRGLIGLVADPRADGAAYRTALFALTLAITYMALITTYSVALGFIFTLLLPFLVATLVLGRTPGKRITALAGRSA